MEKSLGSWIFPMIVLVMQLFLLSSICKGLVFSEGTEMSRPPDVWESAIKNFSSWAISFEKLVLEEINSDQTSYIVLFYTYI